MTTLLSQVANAAHGAAVAATTISTIKPGDTLPTVPVKDIDMKEITLHDVPGKIVIVRLRFTIIRFSTFLFDTSIDNS